MGLFRMPRLPRKGHCPPASPDERPVALVPYELTPGKNRPQCASVRYDTPADTRIEVFWKSFVGAQGSNWLDPRLVDGIGPVLSFIVAGREVLRFDCLGDSGHYHVALMRPSPEVECRLWFRERSQIEQVERSIFELERNLEYYLARNPQPDVRSARVDPQEHRSRCAQARSQALALWARNATEPPHATQRPTPVTSGAVNATPQRARRR
jgi:hypothetical protein